MPVGPLRTRRAQGTGDVVAHFDAVAPEYREAHGPADRLLAYRLGVIRHLLGGAHGGTLLEIGCGPAAHLLALAGGFARAIGTDASPAMVAVARERAARSPNGDRVTINVDPAEALATIESGTVDVALCVGAFEHMVDKASVLRQVGRVLTPTGRFVVLTPNGGSAWYRHVAPVLGCDTRHLSTDRFVTGAALEDLLAGADLRVAARRYWRFVPNGDLPRGWGPPLRTLDRVGAIARSGYLRGGLGVAAVRR
ncbi:MAG: class I SAM-dependent methyltransferase [Acidimicrobiales bacterium]